MQLMVKDPVTSSPFYAWFRVIRPLNLIIIAIAIIAAAIIYAYYNPYESCKRDLMGRYNDSGSAVVCSGSTVLNP